MTEKELAVFADNINAKKIKVITTQGNVFTGVIDCLGDYDALSSYSVEIKDVITQLSGQFWIKSDTHKFENGQHTMKLEIEFENLMTKEKVDHSLEAKEKKRLEREAKKKNKKGKTPKGKGRRSTRKSTKRKVEIHYAE